MIFFENTLITVISLSTPLVIAVIGETISEKSGVINLSAEGTIMICALFGFMFGYISDIAIVGFLFAMLLGAGIAIFISYCDIKLRMDQIAVGFVLTMLLTQLSNYLGQDYVRINGPIITKIQIPLLSKIPFLGNVLFNHSLITYFSILLIPSAWFFINKTTIGLHIRSAGENPLAANSRGIDVKKMRFLGTLIGGSLLGLAGATFSLYTKYGWSEGHTTNYGWIILAIAIFGGWNPYRAAVGAYSFGLLQVLAIKAQSVTLALSQILPLLPFPMMIFILIFIQYINTKEGRYIPRVIISLIVGNQPEALGKKLPEEIK
jgi:simple sugar transport system permease protein